MKILTFKRGIMFTNSYLVIADDYIHCFLIDAGGDAGFFINKLREKTLSLEFILLTHGHFDHITALNGIREATKAPVYIHTLDSICLTDTDISYMKAFAGINDPCDPADYLLDDGDTINFCGGNIDVLHTPGHTEGSVCYKLGSSIFTGDTLFAGSIGRTDLLGGNYLELMNSLSRLRNLEGDYKILPGHGSSSTLENERKNNVFIK